MMRTGVCGEGESEENQECEGREVGSYGDHRGHTAPLHPKVTETWGLEFPWDLAEPGAPRKCGARNLKGGRRPETLTVPWRLPQPGGVRSPRQGQLSLDPSDAPSSCLSLYGRWKF